MSGREMDWEQGQDSSRMKEERKICANLADFAPSHNGEPVTFRNSEPSLPLDHSYPILKIGIDISHESLVINH